MIAQSVADILGRQVRLAVEGIDRMYLNVHVPRCRSIGEASRPSAIARGAAPAGSKPHSDPQASPDGSDSAMAHSNRTFLVKS
jgi:hypothetical protein